MTNGRRHSHAPFWLAIGLLVVLAIMLGSMLAAGVGPTHYVTVAGPTVTTTETAAQPAEPAPAPTVTKKVRVYVTRTALPQPSPAPGVAPGGQHVTVTVVWKATIHIGRHILDLVCQARKSGSHAAIPPAGNDAGTHVHCTGLPRAIRGFNMTVLCGILTQNLPGHWIDLGNENDPNLWECQRE